MRHKKSSAALAALSLAACASSDPTLHQAPPAGPDTGVEIAPTAPFAGVADWDPDAGEILAEVLRDRARAQPEPDARTDSPGWEAFYDPAAVHEVQVSLTEDARRDLASDGRTWVPAFVTVDGIEFPNAGIRRKGNTTWRSLDDKPSLKIKLREFGEGPRLVRLERLTLNNMVSDPAQVRENLALQVWRALGATASRSSWAEVWIDGAPYGLYSNIESLDDEWLQRRYDRYEGDLWEANEDADFTDGGLSAWELAEGLGDTTRLAALADALESDAPSFEAQVGHLVDVDQFLDYWAACLLTGMTDGYPFHLNDAFVYADPGDAGRLDFVPWGMDEAWGDFFNTWTAGKLAVACDRDEACEARLREKLVAGLATLESLPMDAMIADAYALTDPLVAEDPRSPYTHAMVTAARVQLRDRILGWPAYLRADLGL